MEDYLSRRQWASQNSRRRTNERKNHIYTALMIISFILATLSLTVNGQGFFQGKKKNTLDNDSIIQAVTSSMTMVLIVCSIGYTYKRNRKVTQLFFYIVGVFAIFTAIYGAIIIYRSLVTPKCNCNTDKIKDVQDMLKEGPSTLHTNSSGTRDKVLKILDKLGATPEKREKVLKILDKLGATAEKRDKVLKMLDKLGATPEKRDNFLKILEKLGATAEKGLESTTKKKSSSETTTTTSNGVERRTEETPSFIIEATCDCGSTKKGKFPKDQIYITVSYVILFISQVMHEITIFKWIKWIIKRKALDKVLEGTESVLASSLNNFNFLY